MSYHKESFGIMDQAYFVPRGQIIDWVNELLNLNITKIQQFGSGAVYCQIVDIIHPGKVTMNKVNWRAKNDYEFINNLKILQSAFEKVGVKRYVEVEKLSKAKYQDNLEFIQWLKRYFDLNCGDRGKDYDPRQRRGNCAADFSFAQKNVVPKSYNGSGQIIGPSKTEVPQKKTSIVPTNRIPLVDTKPNKQERSKSPTRVGKKEESKGGNLEVKYKNEVNRNKEFSKRYEMIEEVLGSGENAETKIAMIEEIMNFTNQHNSNEMAHEDDENI